MAIPISQGSLDTQIKSPQVAQGQALDLSEQIGANLKQASAIAKQTMDSVSQVYKLRKDARDQEKVQDAYNEYMDNITHLNTELSQKKLQDALDFAPKYTTLANTFHRKFMNDIRGTGNIGEQFRQQVNKYNLGNQATYAEHMWKEQEAVRDNATNGAINNAKDTTARNLNTLNAKEAVAGNVAIVNDGLAFVLGIAGNRLLQQGYRVGTEEYEMKLQAISDDFILSMVNEVSKRPENGIEAAYALGNQYKNYMSTDKWQKMMHDVGKSNLVEQYAKNPEQFLRKDGSLDLPKAAEYSNELRDEERRYILKDLLSSNGNGAKTTTQTALDKNYSDVFYEKEMLKLQDKGIINDNEFDKKLNGALTVGAENKYDTSLLENIDPMELNRQFLYWEDVMNKGTDVIELNGQIFDVPENENDQLSLLQQGGKITHVQLTEERKRQLRGMRDSLIKAMENNPSLYEKGFQGTLYFGKKPKGAEVFQSAHLGLYSDAMGTREGFWKYELVRDLAGLIGIKPERIRENTEILNNLNRAREKAISNFRRDYNVDLNINDYDSLSDNLQQKAWEYLATATAEELGSASNKQLTRDARDLRNRYERKYGIEARLNNELGLTTASPLSARGIAMAVNPVMATGAALISTYYYGKGLVGIMKKTTGENTTGEKALSMIAPNTLQKRANKSLYADVLNSPVMMTQEEKEAQKKEVFSERIVPIQQENIYGKFIGNPEKFTIMEGNIDTFKEFDSLAHSLDLDIKYTSTTTGKHKPGAKGHYAGQKVDAVFLKNGQEYKLTPEENEIFVSLGFWNSEDSRYKNTGAIGFEPRKPGEKTGHYDVSIDSRRIKKFREQKGA